MFNNNNIQAYINQIKDVKLIDLVQSQTPLIISHVIQSYIIKGNDYKSQRINEIDENGFTALHKACARGLPEIVEILLQNNIDLNKKNNGGETACLIAAKRGNPVVLKLLKDYGADLNFIDLKGQGLAHYAVYTDNVYVLLWIESATNLSLNSKDFLGQTPLHLSCILGKINTMKFLLKKSRANISERTLKSRDSCLHLAVENKQLQCVSPIIFKASIKESFFSPNPFDDDNCSSIALWKNRDNKTPIDLFMEKPHEYKASHRLFWYFFSILQMSSLSQLKINLSIYRLYLFFFPFLSFSFSIILSLRFVEYRIIVFIAVSFLSVLYVRLQGHRINNIDNRPNPIFAGAYLAGIIHTLICFFVNIYPKMGKTEWEILLSVFVLPLLVITYIRLIFADPGRLQVSEITKTNFSQFIDDEVKIQKNNNAHGNSLPLDKFCTICEILPAVDRVKHCKLCDICIVNLDHHCLFLMKCISLNNLRKFIFLIFLSVLSMCIFIETSIKMFILACGPLSGANPVEFVVCSYRSETWISTVLIFNIISVLWASFMLSYQLSVISNNSTAYFNNRTIKSKFTQKILKVLHFVIKGTFYQNQERTSLI